MPLESATLPVKPKSGLLHLRRVNFPDGKPAEIEVTVGASAVVIFVVLAKLISEILSS